MVSWRDEEPVPLTMRGLALRLGLAVVLTAGFVALAVTGR